MSSSSADPVSCLSCGADGVDAFCPGCGEPAAHHGDLSLRHLTHDFLHEFTHLDGKIWRTLHALLLKPGLLTAEYWAGRRGLWVRPLRLYLVISALTLLLAPSASGPLGLRTWVNRTGDYTVGNSAKAASSSAPINEELSHRISKIYLTTRYLSLAVLAAALWAVARKRQPFYGAHLISAMHFDSFGYLATAALAWLGPAGPQIAVPLILVYLVLFLRRLYGESWLLTLSKSIVVFLCLLASEMVVLGFSVWAAARFATH